MVFESIAEQFMFSRIRDGREGIQLQRTFRAISFLLYGWSTFTGDRKPLYGRRRKTETELEPLPVIHFEKFALFVARIWKKVYDHTGGGSNIMDSSLQGNDLTIVTFPFPFQEYQAKHGRRLRRINGNNKHVYIIQILHQLVKEKIYYFEIETPQEEPDNPDNYKTSVKPPFPIDGKEFLQRFTPFEVNILTDLENSLKRLGASQVRALGTHENRDKTIEDIHKEFLDMDRYIRPILVKLDINEGFFDDSYEMMTYADEAWRKSTSNRQDYEEACEIMLTEMKSAQVIEAFKSCQRSSAEIWDDQIVAALAEPSKRAKAITGYLHAVSYYRDHINERSSKKSIKAKYYGHLWDDSVKEIKKCGLAGFPPDIQNVFVGETEKIRFGVRDRLRSELESLKIWIKENTKNAQRELCLSQDASGP